MRPSPLKSVGVEFNLRHGIEFGCLRDLGCLGDHEYSIARLSMILNPYVPAYLVVSTIDVGGAFETDFESGTCIDAAEDVGVADLVDGFNDYVHGVVIPRFKEGVGQVLDGLVGSAYGLDVAGVRSGLGALVDSLIDYGFEEEGRAVEGLGNELVSRVKRGVRDEGLVKAVRAVVEVVNRALHKYVVGELARKYLVLTNLGVGYSVVLLRAGLAGSHELPSDYYMQDSLLANLLPGSVRVTVDPGGDEDVEVAQALKAVGKHAAAVLRLYLRARGIELSGLGNPAVGDVLIGNAHLVPSLVKSLELGHVANIVTGPRPALIEYPHVGVKAGRDADSLATLLVTTTALRLIY